MTLGAGGGRGSIEPGAIQPGRKVGIHTLRHNYSATCRGTAFGHPDDAHLPGAVHQTHRGNSSLVCRQSLLRQVQQIS